MTDPRDLLRPAVGEPEVDLGAVHGRARQIARRRRTAAGSAGLAAVVAVVAIGGLAVGRSAADEQLRPPPVAATGTPSPAPSAPPTTAAPTTPAPTATPTPGRAPSPSAPRATTPPAAGPSAAAAPSAPRTTPGRTTPGPTTPGAASAAPPFVADTRPDVEAGSGGQLALVGVRVARQAGYDRVVYEFSGPADALPGWRVEYVDAPVGDPSGLPVPVRGTAWLQVVLDQVEPGYTGGRQIPSGTRLLREVVPVSTFEGRHQSFLGLEAAKASFRVLRLANPARVVVDVVAP